VFRDFLMAWGRLPPGGDDLASRIHDDAST
jgi:hypothetical protein